MFHRGVGFLENGPQYTARGGNVVLPSTLPALSLALSHTYTVDEGDEEDVGVGGRLNLKDKAAHSVLQERRHTPTNRSRRVLDPTTPVAA